MNSVIIMGVNISDQNNIVFMFECKIIKLVVEWLIEIWFFNGIVVLGIVIV